MTEESSKYPYGLQPIEELTPESCAEIAKALAVAIRKFKKWGLRVSESGRLRMAEKWLNEVASRGYFGNIDEELIRTGKAAALAADFFLISTSLEDEQENSLATEIGLSLGGSLDSGTKDTTPYEFQSQFWTGTLLAQSGLKTTYLGGKRKGTCPDFLVESNTFECAVEIKRPQSKTSALRALSTAASQLHKFGKPGIIVIDHSGSLFTDDLIIPPPNRRVRDIIGDGLSHAHNSLRHEIQSYTRSDKYSRIVLLVSFARFWSWERRRDLDTYSGIHLHAYPFPEACSGLVRQYSEQIQASLVHGVRQLSGNEPDVSSYL